MKRWLLIAEADKIQDFLFRSSRLAQVAGGSSLLARFCREMPEVLGVPEADRIIHAGGSFRLRFGSESEAAQIGRLLAETYYRAVGGSLTVVTPPVEYEDGEYRKIAGEEGQKRLRKAKNEQKRAIPTAHLPQVAFCASCGELLAESHESRFTDERDDYLCGACGLKAAERTLSRTDPTKERFLNCFLEKLVENGCQVAPNLQEEKDDESPRQLVRDADHIGAFDPRGYVAYVLADGNGMGVLFGKCPHETVAKALSDTLDEAMWSAFSKASSELHQTYWEDKPHKLVPALPLIVGGDDLFALIAAPCAIDFARRLCSEFEEEMRRGLAKPDLQCLSDSPPTLSAAVVICKASYPYNLAHRHGERLLEQAKQLAKARKTCVSVVDFEVVLGSDWEGGEVGQSVRFVPSFRPYYAVGPSDDRRLSIDALLDQRKDLEEILPGKRKEELRRLFQTAPQTASTDWDLNLEAVFDRIRKDETLWSRINESFEQLGDPDGGPGRWKEVQEPDGRKVCRQGVPDLLEAWHFLHRLGDDLGFLPRV